MKLSIYDENNKPYLCDCNKDIDENIEFIDVEIVDGNENIYLKFENINILATKFDFAFILKNPEREYYRGCSYNNPPTISFLYRVTKDKLKEWEELGEKSKSNHVAYDRMIEFLRNYSTTNVEEVEILVNRFDKTIKELTKKEQCKLEQKRKNKDTLTMQVWRKEER